MARGGRVGVVLFGRDSHGISHGIGASHALPSACGQGQPGGRRHACMPSRPETTLTREKRRVGGEGWRSRAGALRLGVAHGRRGRGWETVFPAHLGEVRVQAWSEKSAGLLLHTREGWEKEDRTGG